MSYELLSNELRLRVLDGEDVEALTMLAIVNDIRRGRRAAASVGKPAGPSARKSSGRATSAPLPPEDLRALLDDPI